MNNVDSPEVVLRKFSADQVAMMDLARPAKERSRKGVMNVDKAVRYLDAAALKAEMGESGPYDNDHQIADYRNRTAPVAAGAAMAGVKYEEGVRQAQANVDAANAATFAQLNAHPDLRQQANEQAVLDAAAAVVDNPDAQPTLSPEEAHNRAMIQLLEEREANQAEANSNV